MKTINILNSSLSIYAQLKANPATPAFIKNVKEKLVKENVLFLYGAKIKSTTKQLYLRNLLISN